VSFLVCASNRYPAFEGERIAAVLGDAALFDPSRSRDVTWDLLDLAYDLRPSRIVIAGVARIDPPLVRELGTQGSEVLVIAREVDQGDLVRLVSILHWAARGGAIGARLHQRLTAMGAPRLARLSEDAFASRGEAPPSEAGSGCLLLAENVRDASSGTLLRLRAEGHCVPGLLPSDRVPGDLAACRALTAGAAAVIDLDALRGRARLVDLSFEAAPTAPALPRDRAGLTTGEDLRELGTLLSELVARTLGAAPAPVAHGLGAREFLLG
jgi:hypothetical protein